MHGACMQGEGDRLEYLKDRIPGAGRLKKEKDEQL